MLLSNKLLLEIKIKKITSTIYRKVEEDITTQASVTVKRKTMSFLNNLLFYRNLFFFNKIK